MEVKLSKYEKQKPKIDTISQIYLGKSVEVLRRRQNVGLD